jgi:hypothetical protein
MAKRLVDDYLDISQIEAGKIELKPQPFNLTSLLSEALDAFVPLAAEKSIELKNLSGDSELVVNADQDRIAQVLVNLLSRAIKFSSPGAHVSVQVKDAGHELCVEIEDDSLTGSKSSSMLAMKTLPSDSGSPRNWWKCMAGEYGLKVQRRKRISSASPYRNPLFDKKSLWKSPQPIWTEVLQASAFTVRR